MKSSAVQGVARVLKVLVTVSFFCNLGALGLIPLLAEQKYGPLPGEVPTGGVADSRTWVLTAFLLFCGICTAVVLWQGRRVLNTILRGEPFAAENAVSLKRAAVCAFLIAAAALARLAWGFWFYRSVRPLLTYNALFVPIFAMAGLLCLVMSALFRRAAEIKAENDLTI